MIYKPSVPLTFLSSPKAWTGVAAHHQEFAVRNWLSLHPDNEVILYGDAPGTREACQRLGVPHVPEIAATPKGIPYFCAIVGHAAQHARYDVQVYLNCDIMLRQDFLVTVGRITLPLFLIIGQRIDLPEGEPRRLEQVEDNTWFGNLARTGKLILHPPVGSDYFVFRRGMWTGLPIITIGRGAYDNALIAWCLLHGIPVVDATLAATVLHQFHAYGHVGGGQQEVFMGQEAKDNLDLCTQFGFNTTLEDATLMLNGTKLTSSYGRGDWTRGLLDRHLRRISSPIAKRIMVKIWYLSNRIGLSKPSGFTLLDLPSLASRVGDSNA